MTVFELESKICVCMCVCFRIVTQNRMWHCSVTVEEYQGMTQCSEQAGPSFCCLLDLLSDTEDGDSTLVCNTKTTWHHSLKTAFFITSDFTSVLMLSGERLQQNLLECGFMGLAQKCLCSYFTSNKLAYSIGDNTQIQSRCDILNL